MATVDSAYFPNSPQHAAVSGAAAGYVRSSIIPTAADTARAVDEAMLKDKDEALQRLQEELARSQLEVTSLKRELHTIKINTAAASNNSSLVKIRFSKSFNKKIRFATLVKSPSTVMAMLHLTGRRTPFSYWAQVICPICSSGITTCE